MLRFATDGVTSFSTAPLRLLSWVGFWLVALCAVYLAYIVYKRLFTDDTVAGWVFTSLDRIPTTDEELVVEGIAIHILEADDRRIARMRLTLLQVPAQETAAESRESAHDGV